MLKQRLETVKGRWVFPSPTDKSRPMGYPTIHYAVGCISEKCSVRDWNSHDLRRTVASHLAGSKVSRLVIKKILNHTDRDITAVYDRYDYAEEKKLALAAWDRKIQAISEGTRDTGHVLSFNTLRIRSTLL